MQQRDLKSERNLTDGETSERSEWHMRTEKRACGLKSEQNSAGSRVNEFVSAARDTFAFEKRACGLKSEQ